VETASDRKDRLMSGERPAADGERDTGSPSATPPDLVDRLKRSARGDRAAFAALYDATSPRMYGLVVRVVRDRAQADEVAQEVYLEVWRQAGRFDPTRGSALAWMMTIGHRKAVDRVR